MNFLKQFWSQFVASISKITFYQQLIQKPTRVVLAYFYAAILLLGVGSAAWFQFYVLPNISNHAANVQAELLSSIPDNTGIRTNHKQLQLVTYDATGAATIAQRELRIPSPPSLPKLFFIPDSQMNSWNKAWPAQLLIISPTDINSPTEYLASLDTTSLFLVDRNGFYVFDGSSWEHTSFEESQLTQSELTAEQVKTTLKQWGNVVAEFVAKYAYLIWPISIIGTLLTQTLSLFWYSLLTFLVSKAFNYRLKYRECLKITAYIAVVANCISLITQVIYPWFGFDMFALSYWVICLYVLYVLKTAQTAKTIAQSS